MSPVLVASYFDPNNSGTLGGTFVSTVGSNVMSYAAGTCNTPQVVWVLDLWSRGLVLHCHYQREPMQFVTRPER